MNGIGGSVSLRSAYQRLRGVEASLAAKADRDCYPSLAVQESAERKLLAFMQKWRDGTGDVEPEDAPEDENIARSDPLIARFLQTIKEYGEIERDRERLEALGVKGASRRGQR